MTVNTAKLRELLANVLTEQWIAWVDSLDEIDALRAALQARQWQPIETAPHETLLVLGWYEGEVFKQEIALASAGERHPDGYSNRWWHGRATHWMPLPPAPPQGEKEHRRTDE